MVNLTFDTGLEVAGEGSVFMTAEDMCQAAFFNSELDILRDHIMVLRIAVLLLYVYMVLPLFDDWFYQNESYEWIMEYRWVLLAFSVLVLTGYIVFIGLGFK